MRGMVGNDEEETRSVVGNDDYDVEEEEDERWRGVVHFLFSFFSDSLLFVYNSTSNKNCTIYCIIIIEINGKHSMDSLKSCPALRLLFSSHKHQLDCTFQLNGVWKCVTRQKWKWNNWAFHLILFILNLKHRSRLYKLSST